MRKFYLALFLSILWAGTALAETIDGITYTLDNSTSTAIVTNTPSGSVVIPATVNYNNRTYSVTAITGVNSGITSCEIPEGVTSIGTAFRFKSALTSISIPSTVQRIEGSAFSECSSLISVNIPEGVTYIGALAFSRCYVLPSITIPTTLTSMGNEAFRECRNLKTIIWNAKHCIDFTSQNCSPFYTDCYIRSSVYYYINDYVTSITFGEEVEYIPAYLCCNFTKLSTVVLPNSVKEIGDRAFYCYYYDGSYKYDTNLTSVSFGTGLEKIGSYAFYGRKRLNSVTIPDKCTTIETYAFSNCSNLAAITFGKGITTIGTSAFADCPNINTINIYATTPPVITGDVFSSISDLMAVTLNVRTQAVDAYKAADVWKDMYVQAMENDVRTFTLNVSSAEESMGTTTPGGMFDEGSEVVIYAAAKEGFKFRRWNDGNTNNPRTVEMIGDLSFVAHFEAVSPDDPNPGGGDNPDNPVVDSDTDISSMSNVIYLDKVKACVDSQIDLSIKMKNSAAIRGFQFDIYLPDGVTVVKNAKGKIVGSLSEGRLGEGDEHTLTLSEQDDGAIRFLCGSLYDETFTGTDGEIATLSVQIAANMEDGDYPIILRNIKLTETDINNYYQTDYVKSTLTISSYVLGDVNNDRQVDVSDYIGVANIILTGNVHGTANAPMIYSAKKKETQEVEPE